MKQQPLLGFIFALITAMAWGSLPIALKQVLSAMNAQTIVWYRFVVATIALFILLAYKKKLPELRKIGRYTWLAIIGVLGLAGNFLLFSRSLNYIEPSVAQIFIHLSSFGMLISGVIIFKEKLGLHQKVGILFLLIGLGLFFNDRLNIFVELNQYSIGVILSVTASLIWVAYGMAQKLMLRKFSSQQILLMMYFGCVIVFTPMAEFSQVQALTPFTLICFIYCCLNTLIGYGSYAEALNRWDVSKVSVVVMLVPLFTILFSHISHMISPNHFATPELNSISYIGAFVVVCGAILSAIGHKLLSPHNEK
ncbi:DMT family transporter [Rodentibacter pneumotropicus]|uniref:DMT family transporter n=1 Tax=Rodentibacter pneumotropicus TaxID=758 RepID=A0A4S2PBZ9_9PAST|nr:DMT family transporter [Rodentibacter pneumotropicus]THA00680.1 DMT family transporter [Rodentibacter pneumotropicus]THA01851.1 DMT family transporter [Rodentibacter pneumotropicus]THA05281.1 DMT family transporter [Rodentibacter pneumotropicus]THA17167.1 DMT family transporter [Rodentibacter pneumotropicus]